MSARQGKRKRVPLFEAVRSKRLCPHIAGEYKGADMSLFQLVLTAKPVSDFAFRFTNGAGFPVTDTSVMC